MRSRLRKLENSGGIGAAVVLLLGLAFCFGMYWWQLRYEYALRDPVANLYLVIPFAGLAVMVAAGMGRTAAAVSWLVLAGLTGVPTWRRLQALAPRPQSPLSRHSCGAVCSCPRSSSSTTRLAVEGGSAATTSLHPAVEFQIA